VKDRIYPFYVELKRAKCENFHFLSNLVGT
jgi:hypothetical protein